MGNPNCGLLTKVFTPVYVTRFNTFVASIRQSSDRRSPHRNDRPAPAFSENCAGPRIELRPAFPQRPLAGATNADGFAKKPAAGPVDAPLTSPRIDPVTPVPVTDVRK